MVALTLQTQLAPTTFHQNLKTAWKSLRFQAPGIATKIIADGGENYEFEYVSPKGTQEADEWMATTLLEKPKTSSSQELVSALVNDTKERNKCSIPAQDYVSRLYFSPGSKEGQYHICIFSQHAALDGRGSLLALNILLKKLVEPETPNKWGKEVEQLPLSMSYTLGLRKDGDKAPEGFQDLMEAMYKGQAENQACSALFQPSTMAYMPTFQPFATLPTHASKKLIPDVATQYAKFQTSADAIKKAAKAHHVPFSYTVAAAIALALYKNSNNQSNAKAITLPGVPTDTRFRLPDNKRRTFIANGIVAAGSMMVPVSLLQASLVFSAFSENAHELISSTRKLTRRRPRLQKCRLPTGKSLIRLQNSGRLERSESFAGD